MFVIIETDTKEQYENAIQHKHIVPQDKENNQIQLLRVNTLETKPHNQIEITFKNNSTITLGEPGLINPGVTFIAAQETST